MTRRRGLSYRTHDVGPLTVSLFGAWRTDGQRRRPTIDVTYRQTLRGQGAPVYGAAGTFHDAIRYRRVSLPVPWVAYPTAYRLRYVGGRRIYRGLSRFYRWASK